MSPFCTAHPAICGVPCQTMHASGVPNHARRWTEGSQLSHTSGVPNHARKWTEGSQLSHTSALPTSRLADPPYCTTFYYHMAVWDTGVKYRRGWGVANRFIAKTIDITYTTEGHGRRRHMYVTGTSQVSSNSGRDPPSRTDYPRDIGSTCCTHGQSSPVAYRLPSRHRQYMLHTWTKQRTAAAIRWPWATRAKQPTLAASLETALR